MSTDFFDEAVMAATEPAETEYVQTENDNGNAEDGSEGSHDNSESTDLGQLEAGASGGEDSPGENRPGEAGGSDKPGEGEADKEGESEEAEESEIEAPEVHVVKVDGVEQEVPLEDLKSNYSGKVNWSAKYQELAEERKKFQEQYSVTEQKLGPVAKKLSDGDTFGAFEDFVAAVGGSQEEVIEKLLPTIQKHLELTDEQREVEALRRERDALQNKFKTEEERKAQASKQAEREKEVATYLESRGVALEEVQEAYNSIVSGQVELTPEQKAAWPTVSEDEKLSFIADGIVYNKAADRTEKLLDSVDPSLKTNEQVANKVYTMVLNPKVASSDEEVLTYIKFLQAQTASAKPAQAEASETSDDVVQVTEEHTSQSSDVWKREGIDYQSATLDDL